MVKKVDPYELTADDVNEIKNGMKTRSMGVVCPKRNFNGECKVCDALKSLWSFPEKSKQREIARQKSPKATFYANVVLPESPDKVFILEMGKKLGDSVIDGIHDSDKKWGRFIVHPKAGKGREMIIKKKKGDGQYPSYSIEPDLEVADYDVPDTTLSNLYNLDKIGDMMKANELNDDNFMRVSELNLGDTMRVRFLPPWNEESRHPVKPLWRHWGGVTEAEVKGEVEVDLSLPDSHEEAKTTDDATQLWTGDEKDKSGKLECFGKPSFFDEDSQECKECSDYRQCSKVVKVLSE